MNHLDAKKKLEPFAVLLGDWSLEATHPMVGDTVIPGRVSFEWLAGERFLIQHTENEHPDFPDSMSVIGIMEGDENLSMQYFDSRGIHRLYGIDFDGKVLRIWRDAPGFAQRLIAKLSDDGRTLKGVSQLNRDDQGFRDDLSITYRRSA
jgi:hypothetical protein